MKMKNKFLFIRVEGFNTQELAARGSLGALKKVLNPEYKYLTRTTYPAACPKLDPQFLSVVLPLKNQNIGKKYWTQLHVFIVLEQF